MRKAKRRDGLGKQRATGSREMTYDQMAAKTAIGVVNVPLMMERFMSFVEASITIVANRLRIRFRYCRSAEVLCLPHENAIKCRQSFWASAKIGNSLAISWVMAPDSIASASVSTSAYKLPNELGQLESWPSGLRDSSACKLTHSPPQVTK
ncbi:uncharacterized protein LOC116655298 isoform X2 [Drosophila ananassae]|uniref:uncharacterized protein LOC116655298 isoform X2 n=1 Tax=Drosophila ananassae TaxID=7217 RepID=UPI0013A5EED8|nr:uncharacterized protein LOC116655298 isoform X2 [Drosophila ananassae]